MNRKIVLIICSCFFFAILFSQDIAGIWENSTFVDADLLNQRTRFLLKKKDRKLAKRKDLEFINIPVLKYTEDSLRKEDVLDLSFLEYLEETYSTSSRRKEFLFSLKTYVVDSTDNLLAMGNYKNIQVYKEMTPYLEDEMEFVNLLRDKKMDFIFIIATDGIVFNQYLGIKDNQIYGIKRMGGKIQIYDKKELIDNHWEEFFASLFLNRVHRWN